MVLDACCRWASAIENHFQKEFCETVAEVMDAEVEEKDKIHHSKRPRVAERVAMHVPPEVEPLVERISEFFPLAHTRLGTSRDPRSGERCVEPILPKMWKWT